MNSPHASSTEGQGRPRAAHLGPEARRPLVLDAALQVWNDLGAAGVTMAAVAEQAQVSKPVLYECF
ncbi:MAG: TetR/AcrR family transcriptional regulator, partial [Actinomycetales bacterium]